MKRLFTDFYSGVTSEISNGEQKKSAVKLKSSNDRRGRYQFYSIIPLVAGFTLLIITSRVSAFGGFGSSLDLDEDRDGGWERFQHRQEFNGQRGQHRMMNTEHHEVVEATIAAGDYEAFLEVVADTPMAERIVSEEDFNKLQALHVARDSGDSETARKLAVELGLPGGRGNGFRRVGWDNETHKAVQAAFEAGNYEDYLIAVANMPKEDQIKTEDEFVLWVELHEARELGDTERAEELARKLGLPERKPNMKGWGTGGKRNGRIQRRAVLFDEVDDYEGFENRFGTRRIATRVTPEIFDFIKDLIAAYDAGDTTGVQALVTQIKSMIQ